MDRVLVVDDSPVVCTMLRDWLTAAGYEIEVAGNGQEALAAAHAHAPDLMLIDLVMPELDGIELTRVLKANEKTSRVPVVILTAHGTSINRIHCLDLGAEDFLNKPVEQGELLARVRSLLRAKHLADRLLISFLELDKLGVFAETFATQSIADWTDVEVASAMAQHFLGGKPDHPHYPKAIWAARAIKGNLIGAAYFYRRAELARQPTSFPADALAAALCPHDRGSGQFICKEPTPPAIVRLLRLPRDAPLPGYAALWVDDRAVLAAGYPWEAGAYEIPLLRAMMRHWAVFERIRSEAQLSEKAFFSTIEALALAAEYYDTEMAYHIRRVSALVHLVSTALGQAPHFVKWLSHSSILHDVGKITIPVELLRKPGVFTPEERAAMQLHTVNGSRLVADLGPLQMARNIARCHHENYDGSGYPDGLVGDRIPIEARIVRIVDVYDALRTARPYKRAYSHQEAVEVVERGDGRVLPTHFDPQVLASFLDKQADVAWLHGELAAPDAREAGDVDEPGTG